MSHHKPRRVHIEVVTKTHKGKTYRSVLLRRTFREGGKVKHETLGNLSDLPDDLIAVIRRRLAEGQPLVGAGEELRIVRSLPHGNVAAVLGTAKNIGLDRLLFSTPCRERDLVLAMIVDRVISPGSKLSCSVGLNEPTAQNTLAEELRLGEVDVHDLYDALDWLLARQKRIENKLAKRHLSDGTLMLFDVSSSYYTGRKSSLIQHGYSRDHRGDRPQIVYGLLCDRDGRPIAVEVFPGNTADPTAFTDLVQRVRQRFGIERVVFVGDRGMITTARINEDLRGEQAIGLRVGKVIGRYKMQKHFELEISENGFSYARREENIAAEAALDGLYVIRTSVSHETMSAEETVGAYKSLSQVERAFRSLKTVDLQLRPIYHHNDDRIRAHVFLCMLAYYVEWHMRRRLRDVLFEDTDRELAESARGCVVAPSVRSASARRKDAQRTTESGHPVQSFQDLLRDLSTLSRCCFRLASSDAEYQQLTESTSTQRRALELLEVVA